MSRRRIRAQCRMCDARCKWDSRADFVLDFCVDSEMHSHTLNPMHITIHRGSREIGGSCVEIRTPGTRLIVDAGAPLAADAPARLPEVPGLSSPGEKMDAVLLSHAHGDHSGLLHLAQPCVPVWMTRGTALLLRAGEWFAGWDRAVSYTHLTLPTIYSV